MPCTPVSRHREGACGIVQGPIAGEGKPGSGEIGISAGTGDHHQIPLSICLSYLNSNGYLPSWISCGFTDRDLYSPCRRSRFSSTSSPHIDQDLVILLTEPDLLTPYVYSALRCRVNGPTLPWLSRSSNGCRIRHLLIGIPVAKCEPLTPLPHHHRLSGSCDGSW